MTDGNGKKESGLTHYNLFAAFTVGALFLAIAIVLWINFYAQPQLDQIASDIGALKKGMETSEGAISDNAANATTDIVDFLKDEAIKHRDFIENERQFLTWILTAAISFILAIFAFFGIKAKGDVERIVKKRYEQEIDNKIDEGKERYEREIDSKIDEAIGGNAKRTYLLANVEKEQKAKTKPITFIFQDGDENDKADKMRMESVYKRLESGGYTVSSIHLRDLMQDDEISPDKFEKELSNESILIYQVVGSERKKIGDKYEPDKRRYKKIRELHNSDLSDLSKFVIYYVSSGRIDDEIANGLYSATANGWLTLLERIKSILYN